MKVSKSAIISIFENFLFSPILLAEEQDLEAPLISIILFFFTYSGFDKGRERKGRETKKKQKTSLIEIPKLKHLVN